MAEKSHVGRPISGIPAALKGTESEFPKRMAGNSQMYFLVFGDGKRMPIISSDLGSVLCISSSP